MFRARCEAYVTAERAAATQDATQSKQDYLHAANILLRLGLFKDACGCLWSARQYKVSLLFSFQHLFVAK